MIPQPDALALIFGLLLLAVVALLLRWWHRSFGGAWLFAISGLIAFLVRSTIVAVLAVESIGVVRRLSNADEIDVMLLSGFSLATFASIAITQVMMIVFGVAADFYGPAEEQAARKTAAKPAA
jgi:hypothetical protein